MTAGVPIALCTQYIKLLLETHIFRGEEIDDIYLDRRRRDSTLAPLVPLG